jgi:tetratricopeptide (TPR) repeat protein
LLGPSSSILPLLDAFVERRLYFPMFGLLLIAVDLLRRCRISTPVLSGALGAVLLVEAVICHQRNQVWRNAITLWSDVVSKAPHNARAQFQLAHAYYLSGDCQNSAARYHEAVLLAPADIGAHVNWALALDCLGQTDQAAARLESAATQLAADPQQEEDRTLKAHLYTQLGMIHGKRGLLAAARAALEEAQRSDPGYSLTYVYLGNLEFAANDPAKAAEYYRRALELNPRNELARESLRRLGRIP